MIPLSQKGAANGVAPLGSDSKIASSYLPAIALTDVYTVANETAQLALTAEEGDVAIRTDQNKSYAHNGGTAGTMADWSELLTPTDSVLSVFGRTGAVVAATNDYTWAQIDKTTSDIADITTRSHTDLTDIGTLTHATIDSYLNQPVKDISSPTFAGLVLSNTGSGILTADSGGFYIRQNGSSGDVLFLQSEGTVEISSNWNGGTSNDSVTIKTGGGTQRIHVNAAGFVKIGTGTPTEALDVTGNIKASGSVSAATMTTTSNDPSYTLVESDASQTWRLKSGGGNFLLEDITNENIPFVCIKNSPTNSVHIGTNGVGILKTAASGVALDVSGNIKASGSGSFSDTVTATNSGTGTDELGIYSHMTGAATSAIGFLSATSLATTNYGFRSVTQGSGANYGFHADAQGGTLNIAFYAQNGDVWVQSGIINTGATPAPSANAEIFSAGAIAISEITTPTADTDWGKVYTKSDNKLYFQDGAGTEHEIAFV